MTPERIKEVRERYAHYGPTKNLDTNSAVRHIRELLDALEGK